MSDNAASAITTREFKNLIGRKVAIVSFIIEIIPFSIILTNKSITGWLFYIYYFVLGRVCIPLISMI